MHQQERHKCTTSRSTTSGFHLVSRIQTGKHFGAGSNGGLGVARTPSCRRSRTHSWLPGWERLDHWLATPRGRLALIIVLDQFPRGLFAGKAEAYASDPQ